MTKYFISKLELGSTIDIDNNDLNLFIPVNFTESEIKNILQPSSNINKINLNPIISENNSNQIIPTEINKELKELQSKIELLDTIKQNEKNSLYKIKENIKSKEEQVFLEKIKTETIKRKFDMKKEYYDKIKNKFKIDKNIYFKIKKEIEDGERSADKLPELFVDDYKIFTQMEIDNLLDLESSDAAFKEYIKHKPEKKQNFSTNFDNIFDNDNWGNKNDHSLDDSSDDDHSDDENSDDEENYDVPDKFEI